jgi:signal transduction histidine kinase
MRTGRRTTGTGSRRFPETVRRFAEDTVVETEAPLGRPSESIGEDAWSTLADSIVALVTGGALPTTEGAAAIAAARERAGAIARAGGSDPGALGLAAVELVAALVSGLLVERDWSREDVQTIVAGLSDQLELPAEVAALAVFARAVTERHLFDLPPDLALEAQLRLFAAFTPIADVSVWVRAGDPSVLACLVHLGVAPPSRRVRAEAKRVLDGNPSDDSGGAQVHAIPVVRWDDHPQAALVLRSRPGDRDVTLAFARELAAGLISTLERRSLVRRTAARERSLADASERRFARFGLDLHDGPVQDVLALLSEIRLFRTQLARALDGVSHSAILLGRVDDIDARLVALDHDLRELARSLESPAVLKAPLPELVRHEVEAFAKRTRIEVDVALDGSFDPLTPSQGIALLRIVQEALQNVDSHSGARHVSVALQGGRRELHVGVTDDGRGFDVEPRLVQAARSGHLGLVGMSERVRLLGGRFDVQSSVGGPTTIAATIPRWTPPADG